MDKLNLPPDSKKVFISTKVKKVNAWTKEEDEILLAQAEKYGYRHWKKIAAALKNRSSIQCSARYKRIRPGLVKGNWAKDEDQLVLELVDKFGKNWSLISKYIPSRTGKQIRDRYLNTLDSNINREKFSSDEDQKIIELYLQFGTKWSHIAKFFNKRTGDMIKNRFYSTLRKKVHGYVRSKKNSNRKLKRIRKIRRNSKSGNKNLFKINNLQIIKNEIIVNEKEKDFQAETNNLPIKTDIGEKYNTNLTITEDDLSKLKTDSSIYPKNLFQSDKTSFLPFGKNAASANDMPFTIPIFPPHKNLEQRNMPVPTQQATQASLNPFARLNVGDYLVKIKHIENSMNQSLYAYLNLSSQYQIMSTLYNLYLNNPSQTNNLNQQCDKNL